MPKKAKTNQFYKAIGRRKRALALVRLYVVGREKLITVDGAKIKAGDIYVNNKPIVEHYPSAAEREAYTLPLKLTGNQDRFAISIHVSGGGKSGQIDAISLGISRALQLIDKDAYTSELKKYGLLTRDPRKRERRKVGTGGKARRAKQSPKR